MVQIARDIERQKKLKKGEKCKIDATIDSKPKVDDMKDKKEVNVHDINSNVASSNDCNYSIYILGINSKKCKAGLCLLQGYARQI